MRKNISILLISIILFNNYIFAVEFSINQRYLSFSNLYLGEDKYEILNRKMFNFNMQLNKLFVRKIHIVWTSFVPLFAINALNYAYTNIEYPKRVVSCVLQKDFDALKHETKRFIINTTFGIAGLIDVADKVFNLELYNEDMEQGLAKCKTKCGNYVVLPFVSSVTSRDIYGRILDFALTPTTYIASPIAAAIKMGLLINRTTQIQPLIKLVESNFADSYDITKKIYAIEKYIKLHNYDRKNVLNKIKNNFNEMNLVDNNKKEEILAVKSKIQNSDNLYVNLNDDDIIPDIFLPDYNPQSPVLDSMRTALFDIKNTHKNFWQELSIWNKNFDKKIKTSEVEIIPNKEKYKFKYVLQKDKFSPLAIIFPSVGEGVNNSHSKILSKIFYDEGYSVIIVGNYFQWEFLKSLNEDYIIGNIKDDVKCINLLLNNIISNLSDKYNRVFLDRTAIGTSLGAYSLLFLANEQYETGANNIDKFIAISPPFDLFYAINQIDEIISVWKNHSDDIKDTLASTAAKVIRVYKEKEIFQKNPNYLPFTDYEAKLISSYVFHQKLSDLIYTIETKKDINTDKKTLYNNIYNLNFNDYIDKYLMPKYNLEELKASNSLNSISNYFINNDNYKIYQGMDDYLTNKKQLARLKNLCDKKLLVFNNGSHLGFLYRDEFVDELKKEIRKNKTTIKNH